MNGRRAKIIRDFCERNFDAKQERTFGPGDTGLRRFYRYIKRRWTHRNPKG